MAVCGFFFNATGTTGIYTLSLHAALPISGKVAIFDDLMRLVASDYLIPLVFSLCMLALWLSGRTPAERAKYQLATLVGISALAISNVAVWLINISWDRPRPFVDHGDQLNLLFYPPTDPSFPANPEIGRAHV